MNSTLQLMREHRSVRSYQDKPIPTEVLDAVLDAAWKSPTSINGQQVSLVVVQDLERRRKIAEIAGGQPWIAQAPVFVAIVPDFYKTRIGVEKAGAEQVIHNSVEAFAVGAVDAGIALGNIMTAARSAGLSVVPIGGIRRDPQAMVELLELPELTFPLVGVVLGYADQDSTIKPRLPRASFVHRERYQAAALPAMIAQYDAAIMDYWQTIQRADGQPWSANTAQYYRQVYFPQVAPVARKQGFGFDQ
ncbi:FMN reductase [Chromobacterium sp. LK1]|uniref:NADPH-dependent oxidoreductase n=1 Tax=Chromobacterium sp. LK1 TaxID=1628193 RepID=UPI000654B2E6|nr:NADPH-dependent oxidoreductase [Chromobacterium sp. LK1]KMN34173.1 FMN reductase [Chromobacterium sp. LK1]